MIIFIEDNNIDLENRKHLFAIENILISHYHGNCFAITKSRSLLAEVIDSRSISEKAKMSALAIKENLTFLSDIISSDLLHIKTSGMGSLTPEDANFGWHVNIEFFESGDVLEKFIFIAESLKDIDIYHHSGVHFLVKEGLNGYFCLKHWDNPGGGGSTCDMLERAVGVTDRPILCIVDSDRKSPRGVVKETARKSQNVDLRLKTNKLYILPVRAAENTIPKGILESVFPGNQAFIRNHFNDPENMPFGHANLKFKNTLKMIYSFKEDQVKSDWFNWIERAQPRIDPKCIEEEECREELCACELTPSFSESCLDNVKEYLSKRSPHNTLRESNESINDSWVQIGKLVASYFVTSKGVRTS